MAAISCDICGGTLSMDTSGEFAVCDVCGTKHTKDRLKAKAQEITGKVEVSNIASLESLMKRGNLALEDKKWHEADGYFDKVLDINPEYAPAYAGKLCANVSNYSPSLKWEKNEYFTSEIKKEEDLARYYKPFDALPDVLKAYYQKAIRFADETYKARLEGYNNEIKKRIEELKKEFAFFMIIGDCDTFWETKLINTGYSSYRDSTDKYICNIKMPICLVGRYECGVNFKILRTGRCYKVQNYIDNYAQPCEGVLLQVKGSPNNDYINKGDVAVFTHEMLRLEKEEQQRLENERKRKQVEENNRRLEEEKRKQEKQRKLKEQQEKWASEGLCRYCGGKLGLFGRKCKSCGKEN
jgi:hypothetical protein